MCPVLPSRSSCEPESAPGLSWTIQGKADEDPHLELVGRGAGFVLFSSLLKKGRLSLSRKDMTVSFSLLLCFCFVSCSSLSVGAGMVSLALLLLLSGCRCGVCLFVFVCLCVLSVC